MTPASPYGVNAGSLSDIDDEVDVSVVVVVRATGYLDVLVGHADVVGIDFEVLRGGHDGKFNGTLIAKGLVGPFSDGANLLDGSDTVVANEDLGDDTVTTLFANKVGNRAGGSGFKRVAACSRIAQLGVGSAPTCRVNTRLLHSNLPINWLTAL